MKELWNAKIYQQFLDARTRPACDLLAAIPDSFHPQTICDLGCGPGNSTILLKNRWPQAHIIGLDSSADMLREAQERYPDIHFLQGDIAHFAPIEKMDCLFANASLQWVNDHQLIFPKLLDLINDEGILAIQMPNNFHSPSHQLIIKVLQGNAVWQPLLNNLIYGVCTEPLYQLPWYYDLLTKADAGSLQLWETEYFQEMAGYEAIFDWLKGTGLRPVLSVMDRGDQTLFASLLVKALAKAYPMQANQRVLLPYRRVFMVGIMQV